MKPISSKGDKEIFKYSPFKKKIAGTSVCILMSVVLFFNTGLTLSILDDNTDTFFSNAITKAGGAYATCRILNASVSVVKESHVSVSPAGVGISLALGQILDPIDDMTERASDILVTSITSLGVQKLVYEITVSLAPSMLAVFLFMASVLIWFENEKIVSMRKLLMKIILVLIISRFALPISAIANNYLQDNFFDDKISKAENELAIGSDELDKLMEFSFPEFDGIMGTIKNSTSLIQKKTIEFKRAVSNTVSNAGDIIDSLLTLSFLYVGIFIIQVIILPLLAFLVMNVNYNTRRTTIIIPEI